MTVRHGGTIRRSGWVATALVLVAVSSGVQTSPALGGGGDYRMATTATYLAEPEAGRIAVSVAISFTNTYAAPAGQSSVFQSIRVGIHDHAAAVAASDSAGGLTVSTAASDGVTVATIGLRSPVAYNQTVALTLSYELRHGDDPAIWIGPHLVSFPAWGFGTESSVTVDLPADFEIRVDGNALAVTVSGDRAILESGPIEDPAHWLAHVGATRDPEYETLQQAVPLTGGTADLQVRYWADDPEWGAATMDLLEEALPRLEAVFDLPYPGQGPLVVTEAVGGGDPDPPRSNGEVPVGFAEPPFTVLHQVAHLWAGTELAADRWIREGLASWAAARVAAEMELAPPYDPAAVAADLEAHAVPLAEWATDPDTAEAEAWSYAAAWAVTEQAAEVAGDDSLRLAVQRIAAGLDGYAPLTEGTLASLAAALTPVDSRAFLDHLDAVSDQAVVEAIAPTVLGESAAAEMTARTEARAAYDELLTRAGDWGDPDPVRAAMVEWRFSDALTEIERATIWLASRDDLLQAIDRTGLAAPERLAAAYALHGGGPEAVDEVAAEQAVVAAYASTAETVAAGLDPVALVAFLFGPSPEERLAAAGAAFATGDLRATADQLQALDAELATATAAGLLRILGVIVAVGAGVLVAAIALRRRRAPSDYTPPT